LELFSHPLEFILIFLVALSIGSLIAICIFLQKIENARIQAELFRVPLELPLGSIEATTLPSVTVVIPAYNEAINIADCITAVLKGSDRSPEQFQVWVVDDQSTDNTLAIAQAIQDPHLRVVAGQARPSGEIWVGKNWACHQVIEQIKTDYILFVDADVRLQPGAIDRAITFAVSAQSDLLSVWLSITCGCWGEWFCQPIIASLFAAAFELDRVNDPADPTVMAVGQFMLFRRSAYLAIGGHRAVATEVAEDVEIARRVKQAGLKYWYGIGTSLASVQMYRDLPGLWEGWTKNWHLGSQRNVGQTLYSSFAMFLIYAAPALVLLGSLLSWVVEPLSWQQPIGLGLAGIALLSHYWIRRRTQSLSNIPTNYWWLTSVGGWIMTVLPIASLIKTETGWGWTWRGRSLQLPPIDNLD
jgi:glycosyltransferase involved in cell wall biosynthesis